MRPAIRHFTASFSENYAKLYFDAKQEKGLNRDSELFSTLFSKKVPFLANIGRCLNFYIRPCKKESLLVP